MTVLKNGLWKRLKNMTGRMSKLIEAYYKAILNTEF